MSYSTWAIKVVQKNGEEEYLCDRLGSTPSKFPSRAAAQKQVDFMKMSGIEVGMQSINVVKYPAKKKVS